MAQEVTAAARTIDPDSLLQECSDIFDETLRELFELSWRQGGKRSLASDQLTLVALGGYGRRTLYPYSDLDLLLIPSDSGFANQDASNESARNIFYPLWDAGVSIGHAVRTIEASLKLAENDLAMKTALLDARYIAGATEPFEDLKRRAREYLFAPKSIGGFVKTLWAARAKRHPIYGDTVYLLEPNIKYGRGGLRDLDEALWAACARFRINDLSDLAGSGVASQRQENALMNARTTVRRIRILMHVQAGRAQDRLIFETQEAVAPLLFPPDAILGQIDGPVPEALAAVTPAVEELMHAYYESARAIALEGEGILQRASAMHSVASPQLKPLGGNYFSQNGEMVVASASEVFWRDPAELLRVFVAAEAKGLRLHRTLKDNLAEAIASRPGVGLGVDDRSVDLFRTILTEPGQKRTPFLLEEIHDLGLLEVMIPEFRACRGRVQHDLYHVYTVDQHSLYVVALLKAWQRGEGSEAYPMPVRIASECEHFEALMLAGLLHDIAKPFGKGHAQKGARIASGVAARLGIKAEDQADTAFLVRHHLAMVQVSQRRDLADPLVIESFARLVGTLRRLRKLYLLSVADAAMTSPDNLNAWKAGLLDELYLKTHRRLVTGSAALPQSELEERRQGIVSGLQTVFGKKTVHVVQRLPDEFIATYPLELLLHHVGVVMELETEPSETLRIGTRSYNETTILTVCCENAHGLLSLISGELLLHRIKILGVHAYTLDHLEDGNASAASSALNHERRSVRPGRALDIFWVEAPDPSEFRSWLPFISNLKNDLLDGGEALAARVLRDSAASPLPERVLPPVDTSVLVHSGDSDRATIVEVNAANVWGLLHGVTEKLSALGLEIDVAKAISERGQVFDVFYVRDAATGKRLSDDLCLDVQARLKTHVDRLAKQRRRGPTEPYSKSY